VIRQLSPAQPVVALTVTISALSVAEHTAVTPKV